MRNAIGIKPNMYEAYNNWGSVLADRARLKDDERFFKQACREIHQKLIEINPNLHDPYNNWGNVLADLAKLKDNEELFRQAFDKYAKTIQTKPDMYEAYSNWGYAPCADLAELKNDEELFKQACEKFTKAIEIRTLPVYSTIGASCSPIGQSLRIMRKSLGKPARSTPRPPNLNLICTGHITTGAEHSEWAKIKSDEELFKQACEKYAKIVEIKPDDYDVFVSWSGTLLDWAKIKLDKPDI